MPNTRPDFVWELGEAVHDGVKDGPSCIGWALMGLLVAVTYLVAIVLSPLARMRLRSEVL